jgi:hypothetical protein
MLILGGFDFLDEYDEPDFMLVFVSTHVKFGIYEMSNSLINQHKCKKFYFNCNDVIDKER